MNRTITVNESEYEAISLQICYATAVAKAVAVDGGEDNQANILAHLLRDILEKIGPVYDGMVTIQKEEAA